ncbi:MAG: dienelactone hydrolase family protein [Chloroflexota bacterium]|nr:dienelactone hydrolase family protein [Chloroflexota bacterium]MDE2896965.1 dienelactone hydrolase family protein [Chloroflexota bacterium]
MSDHSEPVQANLHHELITSRTRAEAYPTLVLLHGRGDSAAGILPLAYEFERDDLLVLSVQAPLALGGVMAGGYEWYRLREPRRLDETTLRASLDALAEFLEMVKASYPVDPERVVLLGFSQGAVMSLGAQALGPESVAGVIALSGYFPIEVESDAVNLVGAPAFVAHGVHDDIIPVEAGRRTRDLLERHGVDLTYREYPIAHSVSAEEMAEARAWLNQLLGQIGSSTTP